MDGIPLETLAVALAVLLVVSGFFSLAETAMMAANHVRLRHRAQRGSPGARTALQLLGQTDRLLGVILLAWATTLPLGAALGAGGLLLLRAIG